MCGRDALLDIPVLSAALMTTEAMLTSVGVTRFAATAE